MSYFIYETYALTREQNERMVADCDYDEEEEAEEDDTDIYLGTFRP